MAAEADSVRNASTRDDTADQTVDLPDHKLKGAASKQPDQPSFPPKTLDGKYEFVRELGRGSMGQVFVYHETGIDREVAIKFQTNSDSEQAHRFHAEARIAASLQHPNVVTVLADGKFEDTPYIVFEYLDGESLDKLDSAMPWTEVRKLGLQLASGLAAVHKKGLLHRDIKPANAMLLDRDHQQIVKLIDFGVAKSTDAANMFGGSTGTPRYMSPEVWDDAMPTERSDVYSLGLTLYQLCTGEKPPIPPYDDDIRLDLPEIDSAFASVINRCLERDPNKRFASGSELYNALLPLYSVKELLDIDVQQWMRNDRAEGYLWSGRKLARVANVETENLPDSHREFLQLSQARVTSSTRRKQILVGLAVLTLLGVYLGVRYSINRELDQRVNLHVQKAQSHLNAARVHHEQFSRDRQLAIEQLVATPESRQAIASWRDLLELEPEINSEYGSAALQLEIAWALDPGHAGVRDLLGEVLEARASLADETYRTEEREELLNRLRVYSKSAYNRWILPSHVTVQTAQAGSKVTISRYVNQPKGAIKTESVADGLITPFTQALEPGSYLFIFAANGEYPEVRYPVLIRPRTPTVDITIDRPRYSEVPDGFVYVAGGQLFFGYGARRDDEQLRVFYEAVPIHSRDIEEYLIARYETTYRDWLRYLVDVCKPGCEGQPDLVPKGKFDAIEVKLTWTDQQKWQFSYSMGPDATFTALEGETLHHGGRAPGERATQNWLDFPVTGIKPITALRYISWLRTQGGIKGARLCTEYEWERAGRGADTRRFPHGNLLLPDEANYQLTHGHELKGMGLDVAGTYAQSVSPFGVYDLTGNAWEMTLSIKADGQPSVENATDVHKDLVIRGGGFYHDAVSGQLVNRWTAPADANSLVGMRVCSDVPRD